MASGALAELPLDAAEFGQHYGIVGRRRNGQPEHLSGLFDFALAPKLQAAATQRGRQRRALVECEREARAFFLDRGQRVGARKWRCISGKLDAELPFVPVEARTLKRLSDASLSWRGIAATSCKHGESRQERMPPRPLAAVSGAISAINSRAGRRDLVRRWGRVPR